MAKREYGQRHLATAIPQVADRGSMARYYPLALDETTLATIAGMRDFMRETRDDHNFIVEGNRLVAEHPNKWVVASRASAKHASGVSKVYDSVSS